MKNGIAFGVFTFLAAVAAIVGLLMVLASPAEGHPIGCSDRAGYVAWLTEKFQEAPVVIGIIQNGNIMEVWSNTDRSTWTLTVTSPDGQICLYSTGSTLDFPDHIEPIGNPA